MPPWKLTITPHKSSLIVIFSIGAKLFINDRLNICVMSSPRISQAVTKLETTVMLYVNRYCNCCAILPLSHMRRTTWSSNLSLNCGVIKYFAPRQILSVLATFSRSDCISLYARSVLFSISTSILQISVYLDTIFITKRQLIPSII